MNLTNNNYDTLLGLVLMAIAIIAIAIFFNVVYDENDDNDKPSFS